MFTLFEGASQKIARNLIMITGLRRSLAIYQQNNLSDIPNDEVLMLLIGMDTCNLIQTLKEEFITKEISQEDIQDIVDDYVVEYLKQQDSIVIQDGADRMNRCQEALAIAVKFQENWTREDRKDPGPRFYCVKELLRLLGNEENKPIHDTLFEFIYEQHNQFIRYFRTLLEPFPPDDAPTDSGGNQKKGEEA
jgi:hypothetical protein